MQTAKQEVSNLLKRLPEDCTLEDVQNHLYVLQKIERGLNDAAEGRVYTQEEVEITIQPPGSRHRTASKTEAPCGRQSTCQ